MKFILGMLSVFFLFASLFGQSKIINENGRYYFADRLMIKYSKSGLMKIDNNLSSRLGITENVKAFHKKDNISFHGQEINKIFTIKFSSPYNPIYVAKELSKLDNIEWVEPYYLYEQTYTPNDPLFNNINENNFIMLDLIKAQEAWNLSKGSEDIIIAIIDTGVEWEHSDLADNIWTNSEEIADNGIDDDGNGFIDDVRGWDFGGLDGTPDNDPREDKADHGTHIAGLASAVTDNNIGIASIGFKSRIMAVKTSQNDVRANNGIALIAYGFEGIVYAADNGAKVINCSWGGYSYSNAAQAVIDYAVSKGALVVASAGNGNNADNFYPASYDGVLSAAGSNFVDQRAPWSNYGAKIDVSAPGIGIYSTWFNDSYATKQGTSMSAPITAGLAGLVLSKFPNFTPLQVGEQIRINTDNIDATNPGYAKMLGSGRINALKALSNVNSKSVRITNKEIFELGDGDDIFESGETIRISVELTNYLQPISNLNVQLSTGNNNVTLFNSGGTLGSINTLETVATNSDFFEFTINENAPTNLEVNLLVSYSDANYEDFEWISVLINPTYQIQTTENLSITFNSSGSIGFDDYPTNLRGKGLIYKDGPNLMFEGALVYGISPKRVVSSARDLNADKDDDFSVLIPISQKSPGLLADNETYSKFSDSQASPASLGIETEVYTYSFSNALNDDYMFIRYAFKNTTTEQIENFYVGQYWDFDMDGGSYEDDMVAFDSENNFGYAFDDDGNPVNTYIGLALLSEGNTNFFAMDNLGESNPTISWDGFSDSEKWTALTSGMEYTESGPNDISLLISGGPYSLVPNNPKNIDFLVAAGDDIEDLQNNVAQAKIKYQDILTDIDAGNLIVQDYKLDQNYPNPFNPSTTIKYTIPTPPRPSPYQGEGVREGLVVSLKIFDVLGREIATLVNEVKAPGIYEVTFNASSNSTSGGQQIASGVYYYQLRVGDYNSTKKMLLLK